MKSLSLIIHNIRSAYNVGSMFRTADGAGVKKIYICGYSPRPDTDRVAKTALGAQNNIHWEQHKQTWRLLEKLKKQGFTILALEQHPKSINLFDYTPVPSPQSLALLVGNEVKGLSPAILRYADAILEIPMRGKKESLNVAVAAGIALYHVTLALAKNSKKLKENR